MSEGRRVPFATPVRVVIAGPLFDIRDGRGFTIASHMGQAQAEYIRDAINQAAKRDDDARP